MIATLLGFVLSAYGSSMGAGMIEIWSNVEDTAQRFLGF